MPAAVKRVTIDAPPSAETSSVSSVSEIVENSAPEFPFLPPPAKQEPRLKWVPKKPLEVGRAKVSPSSSETPSRDQLVVNKGLLQSAGAIAGEDDVPLSPVAEGGVILTAAPFIFSLATLCRGIRCEGCLKKVPLKV